MKRIYLDYASTTPMDKKVYKAMKPYFAAQFANPSALYKEAVEIKEVVRTSRQSIARLLNIRPEEVIFTAGGTEADNLALLGVFNHFKTHFSQHDGFGKEAKPHIITTNIEHPGILEVCKYIEKNGGEVTYIPVEANGIVHPQNIIAALKPTTVLVSVMLANNEIGTIQPLRDISRLLQEYRKAREDNVRAELLAGTTAPREAANSVGFDAGSARTLSSGGSLFPYLHTDASQAANYLDLSFQKLGVDMMTLDGSKIYGPKGVGVLAVRKHVAIEPISFGGGQERGMRSGTENVPGIVGFVKALEISQAMREKESIRLEKLRDYFISTVLQQYPGISPNGDRKQRLPNNVNICIPGADAEFLVLKLDNAGIAASAASACLNLSEKSESYVIEALRSAQNLDNMGEINEGLNCSNSSIRFTLGRYTTIKELRLTLKVLASIITTQ